MSCPVQDDAAHVLLMQMTSLQLMHALEAVLLHPAVSIPY